MRKSGSRFTSKEIEALFAVGDINGDGELDINEFINVICPGATTVISRLRNSSFNNYFNFKNFIEKIFVCSSGFKSLEDMENTFKQIDVDGDGKITKEEMTKFGELNDQEVNAIFELGDVDRDGTIDLEEFVGVMSSCAPVPYTVSLPRSL